MHGEASRIANVTVALLSAGDMERADRRRIEGLASRLFEEIIRLDTDARARADRAASIDSARGERILLVESAGPRVCAETLLALVCWPESEAVQLVDRAGSPLPLSIWRRDVLVAALRERARSARPTDATSAVHASPIASCAACERVSLAQLGLEDAPQPLFCGGEDRERCSI